MNTKLTLRLLFVVLAALALTTLVAAAQDVPLAEKQLPSTAEKGESAALIADAAESEPNDSFATADVVAGPGSVTGKIGAPGDIDYFHIVIDSTVTYEIIIDIDAQNGDSPLDSVLCYYDQDRVEIACNDDSDWGDSLLYVETYDPDDDFNQDFYVTVREYNHPNEGGNGYTYTLGVYYASFLSTTTAGSVNGMAFAPGDILARGPDKWLLLFDASDVGITANTNNFDIDPYGVYLTLPKSVKITGQNGGRYTATPWDIIRFNAAQWGPATGGSFANALALDGSTVGLSAASEKIDAIADVWGSGMEISTMGAASVPAWAGGKLAGRDEDILMVELSTGKWQMVYDGSTIPGLAGEDITAAYTGGVNAIYWLDFVIQGTGVIDGHAVTQKDKLGYVDGDGMIWPAVRYFNYNLDAIDGMH